MSFYGGLKIQEQRYYFFNKGYWINPGCGKYLNGFSFDIEQTSNGFIKVSKNSLQKEFFQWFFYKICFIVLMLTISLFFALALLLYLRFKILLFPGNANKWRSSSIYGQATSYSVFSEKFIHALNDDHAYYWSFWGEKIFKKWIFSIKWLLQKSSNFIISTW